MDVQRSREAVLRVPVLQNHGEKRCPHLQEVPASSIYRSLAYCLGLPAGRLMVPSREEFYRFCSSPHHVECPIFRADGRAHAPGEAPL